MAPRPEERPKGVEAEAIAKALSSLRIPSTQYDTLPADALMVKHIQAFDEQVLAAAERSRDGETISAMEMDGYRAQSARLTKQLAAQLEIGSEDKLAA